MIDFKFIFVCLTVFTVTEILKVTVNRFIDKKWSKFIPLILIVVLCGIYWIVSRDLLLGILNGTVVSMVSVGIYQLFEPLLRKIEGLLKQG